MEVMKPVSFFTFMVLFVLTLLGVLNPHPFAWGMVLIVFVGIPLLDFVLGTGRTNPSPSQEISWKKSRVWAPALYLYASTHLFILILAANRVSELSLPEVLLLSLTVGLYTGGVGITVAHELCHKKSWIHQFTAEFLLITVWYQHFAIEHVKGHHLRVATSEDPASARKGENVYSFILRSVTGSFRHAWELDRWSTLRGVVLSVLTTFVAFYFSPMMGMFFLLQAAVAIILLEMVNYIEHYGLARKALSPGRYEKVTHLHSWNSSHLVSNALLFHLQRHSDHHAFANLPYTVLKHHPEAPQLPSGYPGMILLALVPPLWFRFMNPLVTKASET
jgi:alkane 1-monooxygenase